MIVSVEYDPLKPDYNWKEVTTAFSNTFETTESEVTGLYISYLDQAYFSFNNFLQASCHLEQYQNPEKSNWKLWTFIFCLSNILGKLCWDWDQYFESDSEKTDFLKLKRVSKIHAVMKDL